GWGRWMRWRTVCLRSCGADAACAGEALEGGLQAEDDPYVGDVTAGTGPGAQGQGGLWREGAPHTQGTERSFPLPGRTSEGRRENESSPSRGAFRHVAGRELDPGGRALVEECGAYPAAEVRAGCRGEGTFPRGPARQGPVRHRPQGGRAAYRPAGGEHRRTPGKRKSRTHTDRAEQRACRSAEGPNSVTNSGPGRRTPERPQTRQA